MAATFAPHRAPRPAEPRPSTPSAEKDCGMCNGQGGSWETNDGGNPGRNIGRWVPCPGCKGTGKAS
ncbi:hypothetical protein [Nocardiopsis sp. CNR-923]|uniref:hypothetical protein n=1 Tax=Nocardiopsis sp. CNR-923 TaxID=1904965 RepID=UPI00117C0FAF|nr:hypothetical protein [Nocardiopsis sp. CNR-923]